VHAATLAVTQQISPRLGRLAVAVGQGDELLAAVGTDAGDDEQAEFVFLQADVDVDPIRSQVHEVHIGQTTSGERALR
jgi:hypothetical protein